MNAHGDAVGNLFLGGTIHPEPNVSNAITVESSFLPTSLCFTLIDSQIATNTYNQTRLISIHGDVIPNYLEIPQRYN